MTEIVKTVASKFSTSLLSYLNIFPYLNSKLTGIITGRSTHTLKWAIQFYQGILDGSIKHGDRVVLKDFYTTEWVPRVPGGIALSLIHGGADISRYVKYQDREITGRISIRDLGPIPAVGSMSLPLPPHESDRIALGAVSSEEYNTDLGVVLSVAQSVYSQFKKQQLNDNAVEATIEGFVDSGERAGFLSPLVVGLPSDSPLQRLFTAGTKPPFVIRVDSPLQVSFRTHNSHPKITSWMLRRLIQEQRRKPSIKRRKSKDRLRKYVEYDLVANTMANGTTAEHLKHYNAFMTEEFPSDILASDPERHRLLVSGLKRHLQAKMLPDYDCSVGKIQALTEFNGRKRFIEPLFPIVTNLKMGNTLQELTRALQEMDGFESNLKKGSRWVRVSIERKDEP